MSPLLKVCAQHKALIPLGHPCPECKTERAHHAKPRRRANNERLGRRSTHWRQLSFKVIMRHRLTFGGRCPVCLGNESPSDPGTKLTLDLTRGGDHTTATEHECRVICRRCHGKKQGARRAA